jgi:hypothetical protein
MPAVVGYTCEDLVGFHSPSLDIAERLSAEGAVVSMHDPVAMPNAAKKRPDLRYASLVSEAADGADLVLHLTEWSDYRAIDPAALAEIVGQPVMIDARCALDAGLWREAGRPRPRPRPAMKLRTTLDICLARSLVIMHSEPGKPNARERRAGRQTHRFHGRRPCPSVRPATLDPERTDA